MGEPRLSGLSKTEGSVGADSEMPFQPGLPGTGDQLHKMLAPERKAASLHQASHLEAQDDGPDEAQGQPVVPIYDVVRPHVLKVDSLLLQELEGLVHVLQTVDAHSPLGGFRLEMSEQKVKTSSNGYRQARIHCPFMQHSPTQTKTLIAKCACSVQGQYLANSL